MTDASLLFALLGPTNTGKTHRAIERMLEHETGMIGLPLRLLAREVFEKIASRVGQQQVALVTGEEQRVPARPRYWVCTVEAMPTSRDVEFVAIDEVQLAAHDQRGHVFTSRILHARGTKETWLLGADTMRPILADLTPTAHVNEHPRLSRLTHAGPTPLSKVPPRSAIVAFSTPHVYEIAERLRAKKGGAAVVLGGLSPRTRNAQVAMFQAGEVDHLVATDAIGMGLNLDVTHVAFAATRKFDGREGRPLEEPELAQIAGRAGRWVTDGTFGTITPIELPFPVVHAIESHRFAPVRRVRWRNDDLDFTSLAALRESLAARPPRGIFSPKYDAEDALALARVSERPGIAELSRGQDRVRLLWDVCTVPDYKKLLFEAHVAELEELFVELARRDRLGDDWLEARVRPLDDASGDIDTLVARIQAIRLWTYVSHRSNWLASPRAWQQATSAIEDRLSDALHQRLVTRFVEARRASSSARARPRHATPRVATVEAPLRIDPSHPFARLASMRAASFPSAPAEPQSPSAWADAVIDARHEELTLEPNGCIVHVATGRAVGMLVRGPSVSAPDARVVDDVEVGAGARSRLQRRLLAFARDVVADLLGPLRAAVRASGTSGARALLHRLEHGLGTALRLDVDDAVSALLDHERASIVAAGVTLGRAAVWCESASDPRRAAARVALASCFWTVRVAPPAGGAVSFQPHGGISRHAFTAIGYPVAGPRAVRADVLERAATSDERDPAVLANWLGCPIRDVARVLRSLDRVAPSTS